MIPKIDPRLQLTFLDLKETEVPGKTNFFMRMEGHFTDRIGRTFIVESTMSLPAKAVSELPKTEPERSIALRKCSNWNQTLSENYQDGILLPAITFPKHYKNLNSTEVKDLVKRLIGSVHFDEVIANFINSNMES